MNYVCQLIWSAFGQRRHFSINPDGLSAIGFLTVFHFNDVQIRCQGNVRLRAFKSLRICILRQRVSIYMNILNKYFYKFSENEIGFSWLRMKSWAYTDIRNVLSEQLLRTSLKR